MTKSFPIIGVILEFVMAVVFVLVLHIHTVAIDDHYEEMIKIKNEQDSIMTYMKLDIRVLEEKLKKLED